MRKSPAKKRRLLPDAKFNDTMVTQFVNNMMLDGKKSTAFKIFYDALETVETRVEDVSALDVWKKAVENVTPAVEVRSCLLYTSPSPRDRTRSRMPSSA